MKDKYLGKKLIHHDHKEIEYIIPVYELKDTKYLCVYITNDGRELHGVFYKRDIENALVKVESKTKGEGMLGVIKSVVSEVGNFFKENRQVLYWMVIIFLFDKFFLGGTLKNRLTNVCKKLVDKLESDVTK